MLQIAETLLEKEVLSYEDVLNLIGPSPYGDKKTQAEEFHQSTLAASQ